MSGAACVKCGAPLEAGARFCGGCGTQQPGAVIPQAAVRTNAKTMFQGSPSPMQKPAGLAAQDLGLASTIAPQAARAPEPVRPAPVSEPVRPAPVSEARPVSARVEPPVGDLSGRTLNNRYAVEVKIGEGGFGAVYRARQTGMGREVALKVLHPRMAKDPQVVGRFRREAQASSLLRAPHTVQVYDFDQSPEGVMYLAMELLTGRSLHAALHEEGRFSPVRAARVLDGIAESLGEAHEHGIVHRDIKPENVYLEPRPTADFVKVLDFGIAKIVSGDGLASSGPALTAAGQTLGTLEYMSPEQLMGAQLDGRSDLYALGILAYELLTGALPFSAKTPGEMITAHLKTVPPPPSAGRPDAQISPLVDRIVLRLVEKQRDKRYLDAKELRADLARVIAGDSAGPTLTAASQPAAPLLAPKPKGREASGTDQVRTHRRDEAQPRSKAWLLALVLALLALAGGAVAGVLWWLSRK